MPDSAANDFFPSLMHRIAVWSGVDSNIIRTEEVQLGNPDAPQFLKMYLVMLKREKGWFYRPTLGRHAKAVASLLKRPISPHGVG